jgi:hypothetical protein
LAVINLNAADHQPDDVTSGRPVEQVEVLTDPDREVLQAPDHQGQVALGCAGRCQRIAMLLQLGDPGPQVGDPRLELHTLNHPVSIAVNQPPNPAPQGAHAAFDLPDIRIGLAF